MTSFIVDAGVAVKWVVEENGSRSAIKLQGARLEAPQILLAECANALWTKVRRGQLSESEARERFQALVNAPVLLTSIEELAEDAMDLALQIEHPVYDCLYLCLALARNCPLVTADSRLIGVADERPHLAKHIQPLSSFESTG